ncbi:MAG: hypothetical protein KKC43_08430 [Alphaproteobacteria bacterium]|nr:hypothetical protein [Alphaproteobacteria bacterium]
MAAETREGVLKSRSTLKAWLDLLPDPDRVAFARIIAHRAAMRVLPFSRLVNLAAPADIDMPSALTLAVFRASIISRAALKHASSELAESAYAAAAVAANFAAEATRTAVTAKAAAAAYAAAYAADAAAYAVAEAATYAADAADAASANTNTIWNSVNVDARALEKAGVNALVDEPLWPGPQPSWWVAEWGQMLLDGRNLDAQQQRRSKLQHWQIWNDWYAARADGKAPWGLPEVVAEELELRIALGQHRKDFWEREPEAIHTEIREWINAARSEFATENTEKFDDRGVEKRTISQFIVEFLQRCGGPATIDQIREAFSAADYSVVDKTMRGTLSRLALNGEIIRIERGVYEAMEYPGKVLSDLAPTVLQTSGAIQFDGGDDEPISVRRRASVEEWDTGSKAAKRHSELLRLVEALLRRCQERMLTTDSVRELLEDIRLFRDALGATVQDLDPDFAIPRGDGLRQTLSAYEKDDDFSRLPPISDDILLALGKAIPAYNQFISLDDHLAKRDEALLGPDARKRMVGPKEGQPKIEAAVEGGAAKPEVKEVLDIEALPAPDQPDPENRASRRYSESNKNFARRAIEKAWEYASRITFRGAIGATGAGVGGSWAAAKWVWEYRDWLLSTFAENPTMLKIVQDLLEMLAKLPLG